MDTFYELLSNLSIIFLLIGILPIIYFCFLYIFSFFSFIYKKLFKREIVDDSRSEIGIEILPKYEIMDTTSAPPPLYSP